MGSTEHDVCVRAYVVFTILNTNSLRVRGRYSATPTFCYILLTKVYNIEKTVLNGKTILPLYL